jgi:hypothetical protein
MTMNNKKKFDEILKEIQKIISKYKKETDQTFEGLDVAVLIEDLESETKKLKILYEVME